MVSKQETQRQAILHLWNKSVCKGIEIHKHTNILLFTIYDNLKKLKKNSNVNHAGGNGRPKKITSNFFKTLRQAVRRNTSISMRTLAKKMYQKGLEVSHMTISRHLFNNGYKKALSRAILMLTDIHKQKHIEWAQQHLNDDWNRTLFSDETAFQLF